MQTSSSKGLVYETRTWRHKGNRTIYKAPAFGIRHSSFGGLVRETDAQLFEELGTRPFVLDQLGQQVGQRHPPPADGLLERIRNRGMRLGAAEKLGNFHQRPKSVVARLDGAHAFAAGPGLP